MKETHRIKVTLPKDFKPGKCKAKDVGHRACRCGGPFCLPPLPETKKK